MALIVAADVAVVGVDGALPPLLLERITVRDFRNLAHVELEPASRVTVLTGPNGHGKTSLLEAVYFAATSKSFRTSKLPELVRHGANAVLTKARFRDGAGGLVREHVATLVEGRRSVKIDGKRPATLSAFAVRSPVVCFHADELALSSGPAAARRLLLDRVALFVDPASADERARYQLALRSRQRALEARGAEAPDVAAFERLCAKHGAAVTRARRRAVGALSGKLLAAFARVAPGLDLAAGYRPGGDDDEGEMAAAFAERRARDRVRGAAGYGPHRDELELTLGGHAVRAVASQGQHRAITLALKVAELEAVGEARGVVPLLLLDDLSSELDRDRTGALLGLIGSSRGQVLITTTRPELLPLAGLVGAGESRQVSIFEGALVG